MRLRNLLTALAFTIMLAASCMANDRGLGVGAYDQPSTVYNVISDLVDEGSTRVRYPIFLNPDRPSVHNWFEMIDAALDAASSYSNGQRHVNACVVVVMFDPNPYSNAAKIRNIRNFTNGWKAIADRLQKRTLQRHQVRTVERTGSLSWSEECDMAHDRHQSCQENSGC